MSFEHALRDGDLDRAKALLDALAREPETGGLHMPECYADLAQSFDRARRHDEAIAAMESAIAHGWGGRPDGRSDIAEFHLRAGRGERAAEIWAQLKAEDPGEIWIYNAAGLSYNELGEHELAIDWLGQGIELAISTDDPERIIGQLSGVRRQSLKALGRQADELERQVDLFLTRQRAEKSSRNPRDTFATVEQGREPDAGRPRAAERDAATLALSWLPRGQYEQAIKRWPSLAEVWAKVGHAEYCCRLEGNIKWMRGNDLPIRAIAPIFLDRFLAWCQEHDEDPEQARASYAAHLLAEGRAIPWPPDRNQPCWCGSARKYKKCCATAEAAPMHDTTP